MHEEEHIGYKTIAKELDLSVNTVKTMVRRYRIENGIPIGGRLVESKRKQTSTGIPIAPEDYEKRIKELEMQVELLRDFLLEAGRR